MSAEGNGLTSMTLADLGIKSGAISAGPGVLGVSGVGAGLHVRKNSDTAKVAAFDTTGALVVSDVSIRSASTVFKSYGGTVLVKVSRDPKILVSGPSEGTLLIVPHVNVCSFISPVYVPANIVVGSDLIAS